MLAELGQFVLILALLVAALQGVLPLLGAQRGRESWMLVARPAAWLQFGLVFFATLINYIDRLTISVLAPLITKELNLTNTEFGNGLRCSGPVTCLT